MKIAAVSEDGYNISQHFGRAPIYVVLTVEDGKILNKESRPKTGHHTFADHEHPEMAPGERHGFDAGLQSRHASMAETISDCQVLLAGGMGDIELEPGYSTKEVPGRCIKCLAEQESRNCLWELLKGEGRNKDLEQTYEAMIALLKSPELKKLRDESEKYLAEGKNVKIVMHLGNGEPKYEIKVD